MPSLLESSAGILVRALGGAIAEATSLEATIPTRVSGSGFRVSGSSLGFRISGLRFRLSAFGFRLSAFGFGLSGAGFWVSSFEFGRSGFAWKSILAQIRQPVFFNY